MIKGGEGTGKCHANAFALSPTSRGLYTILDTHSSCFASSEHLQQLYASERLAQIMGVSISHISSTSVAQTPQIRDKDLSNPLLCPPVKACALIEPFVVPVGVGSAKRPVPMSKVAPPASRLTTVPETTATLDAATFSVTPSTTTKEECAWTSKPLIFTSGETGDVESGVVLEPMTRLPDGPRLMIVPSMVAAGPSAKIVVPAMENAEGFGVNIWPATV